jgi:hypothetical protein
MVQTVQMEDDYKQFFLFQTVLDEATTAWGIKVERVEM